MLGNEQRKLSEEIGLYEGLFGCYHLLQKKLTADLAENGLTGGQPKVLFYVAKHPGCTQKELATACLVEQATMTALLVRLEEKELVERRADKEDRRALHVYLTENGQEALRKIKAEVKHLEKLFFEGVDADEREVFREILMKGIYNLLGGCKQEQGS